MITNDILDEKIANLQFTENFKILNSKMGFNTLREVTEKSPEELMTNSNFNYVWFAELLDFFEGNGIMYLLQPNQGNSRI